MHHRFRCLGLGLLAPLVLRTGRVGHPSPHGGAEAKTGQGDPAVARRLILCRLAGAAWRHAGLDP